MNTEKIYKENQQTIVDVRTSADLWSGNSADSNHNRQDIDCRNGGPWRDINYKSETI